MKYEEKYSKIFKNIQKYLKIFMLQCMFQSSYALFQQYTCSKKLIILPNKNYNCY